MGNLRDSLLAPVEREIVLVEEGIKAVADVDYPWLAELLGYIVNSGGKRLRPALTLLAGKLKGGWVISIPQAGQGLLPPEPLFAKLDDRVVEEENNRLEESVLTAG